MVDNITYVIPEIVPQISNQVLEPIRVFDVPCYPYYRSGYLQGYTGMFQNLMINANTRGIRVSGSWHTLYKGSNHTDYSLSDIRDTYNQLEHFTDGKIKDAKVTYLETGVNVEGVDFTTWSEYRGNRYHPMISKGKLYGIELRQQNARLKAYNKTKERKLNQRLTIENGLTRVERVQKKSRLISKMGIETPKDFTRPEVMGRLCTSVTKVIDNTKMISTMDLTGLNATELKIYMAMMSNDTRAIKAYRAKESTYKRDRAKYNKWSKKSSKDQQTETIAIIRSKYDQLRNR